jgi:hypothetical protein
MLFKKVILSETEMVLVGCNVYDYETWKSRNGKLELISDNFSGKVILEMSWNYKDEFNEITGHSYSLAKNGNIIFSTKVFEKFYEAMNEFHEKISNATTSNI